MFFKKKRKTPRFMVLNIPVGNLTTQKVKDTLKDMRSFYREVLDAQGYKNTMLFIFPVKDEQKVEISVID